jgi:basic amino acid/polyamine antiporter, APA family
MSRCTVSTPLHSDQRELSRDLTFWPTLSMVVGSVIGVNVFIKPAVMAQVLPSGPALVGVWIAAGLISLAGALLYAELGAMFPKTGGDYVYLREAFGETVAFVYVWMTILIRATVNVAMYSLAIAGFLSSIVPLGNPWLDSSIALYGQTIQFQFGWRQIIGVSFVAALAAINCLGVRAGGLSQVILTAIKVTGAAILIAGGLFAPGMAASSPAPASAEFTMSAFVTTMLAALITYNGWNFIVLAAGEVRDPERNIPRALIIGTVLVICVYCLLNGTYLHLLGLQEIAASNSSLFPTAPTVGAKAAEALFGSWGARALTALFLVSALGVTNGFLLSSSRVPFALARDGLFFKAFGRLNRKNVPMTAILYGLAAGALLTLMPNYDRFTDVLVFSLWIFYTLAAAAVIVLRRKAPDHPRPYRTPLYPVLPLAVVAFGCVLIVLTLRAQPVESLLAVLLILAGVPAFLVFRRSRAAQAVAAVQASPSP